MQGLLKRPRESGQPGEIQHGTAPSGAQPEQPADPAQQQVQQQARQQVQQPQAGQQPAPDDGSDENNPQFVEAVNVVKRSLYETGAADNVSEVMATSDSPAEDAAMLAYELVVAADEMTEGAVPDELVVLLAATVLSEVVEIAEASGVQMQPADIAESMKLMILRYVGESGHDTTELQQAMDQVSPEQFNEMAMAEGAA